MIRSILKSLLKSEAYPEPTNKVELVQTHVSWIFLTETHAYKIKKPVDFGFLNFSTIDRRRFYCNEEVKYNRRLCPDIYEGVVELRKTPDGAAFYGEGPVLDYAVKMKRLPAARMLDQLVIKKEITSDEMKEVARLIAEFHRNAPTSSTIAEYGSLDRIMFNWQENFEQAMPFENTTLPAVEREYIRTWVNNFVTENAAHLNERVQNGFIRECDGDIHLENICLHNDKVCIFDCIEFNERFRCCDTAADVAFLLMDLDFHGRHDLAETVVNTYMEISDDRGILLLIDFYKIYRAFVRGKVESFILNDPSIDQVDRKKVLARAIGYFRLARGYIQRRKLQQTLFITCGLMGSGKSTLAAQLSLELGLPLISSDIVRKKLAGLDPETPVPVSYGEGIYSHEKNKDTYKELIKLAEAELAAGRSVIIDAAFIRKQNRTQCLSCASQYAAAFVILHLSCNDTENRRRLAERSTESRSVSDGRFELLALQQQEFEPPEEQEGMLISLPAASPSYLTSIIYERIG
ncbi:AAA family ATPase [Pelotalea chapellei]|uniref:AAA family ATPase n=1 Tax=Pelotalea chapellei TaxID=44671 RepID=A0ABS5U801_9BACT|nr:bifunctional aminoglycoside phosphotransferase/ATP-binding protein [Pelotalea chapellei]MBT1071804.1 AAA family ATPase [Pelotalea chapellei]